MRKRKDPKGNRSHLVSLVNLIGLEKRDTTIGAKVEGSVKKGISLVLKPGQTPSEWIRETVIRRLREESHVST